LFFYCVGNVARNIFGNLKKKYLRRKRDLKDANRSGTSADVVAKAKKGISQYEFLRWMDDFVQCREGRTNLPERKLSMGGNDEEETEQDIISNDIQDLVQQQQTSIPKAKKPKESVLDDIEFSLISKLNRNIAEKQKASDVPDNEEIFCKSLALDLKKLPPYERCVAKHELRSVLFKHQMAVMGSPTQSQSTLFTDQYHGRNLHQQYQGNASVQNFSLPSSSASGSWGEG